MLYIAAFVLPLLIVIIALIGLHIAPFGDHTLMISDAKGLYMPYLSYVGRFLKGMEGFVYSFEKGLGGNMMPHMGGTMSSPFYAVMALFNITDTSLGFVLVVILNLSVSGVTMYILLADLFGHKRSNLIFSTSYALSGFMIANVFQVIFFSGCHALPLMVLGLRKILQGKNPLLYILSLVYAMIGSFYFGFTLCIASVLFFLVYLWLKKDELQGRRLSIFLNYGVSSIIGGLLPIVIWLPAYMGIMGGRADQTTITDYSFWEKMPFIEIFSKLFTGANTTSQLVDGLPNIFVGLLSVVLVILFFMNKKISGRMKAAAGIVLGFYLLGFYIIAFDMLLHGGTTTNWFHFRYSYIFSFLLIVIAAYEWQHIYDVTNKELKACFIGLLIAIMIIFSKKYEYVMGSEVLLDIGLLLVIFLAFRLHRKKPEFNPRRTFEAVTIFIVSISLFFNFLISTKNIQEWELKDSDFRQTVNAVEPLVTAIQNGDQEFYRMEVNHQLTQTLGNDPLIYGYNGVGHGGSNERNFVREETFKLGVQWYNMRNYYSQGIPAATDALLGIRYLIADEDMSIEKDYIRMTDMKSYGFDFGDDVVYDAYQNPYALPIAFVAGDKVNGLELTNDDLFDNLNQVWRNISSENKDVFVEESDISFKSLNLSDSVEMDADSARKIVQEADKQAEANKSSESENGSAASNIMSDIGNGENAAAAVSSESVSGDVTETHLIMNEVPTFMSSIEFSFTATQDGPVYVYHRGAFQEGNGAAESLVYYMGNYKKGDTVTGYLAVGGDYVNKITFEEYAGRFRAAYADLAALESLSQTVTNSPSTIEKIKDSHLKGTFTNEEGQELLFTIPWDTGWTCYVDGEKVELTKVLGIFMAAEVAPGEHTWEMVYTPGGMSLGIKISIGALILLILCLAFGRKLLNKVSPGKKKDQTSKEEISEEVQVAAEEINQIADTQQKEGISDDDSV